MSKKPDVYLRDIRREVEFLIGSCNEITRQEFDDDPVLQRAVIRSLEIIGEATKNLPDAYRDRHEAVPWDEMAGMRDVLIHEYFRVDYDIVWDVVRNRIPKLRDQFRSLTDE